MLALKIIGGIFAFFGILAALAGMLFRISHWPGGQTLLTGGTVLATGGILMLAIGLVRRNERH